VAHISRTSLETLLPSSLKYQACKVVFGLENIGKKQVSATYQKRSKISVDGKLGGPYKPHFFGNIVAKAARNIERSSRFSVLIIWVKKQVSAASQKRLKISVDVKNCGLYKPPLSRERAVLWKTLNRASGSAV